MSIQRTSVPGVVVWARVKYMYVIDMVYGLFNTENWEELPPSSYWNSGLVIINGELTAVRGFNGYRYTNKLFTLRLL